MNLNFTPFPILVTERLVLRPLNMEDAPLMFALRSHPLVHQYLDNFVPKSLIDIEKLIKKLVKGIAENQWIFWGISLKNNPDLIGTITLWNISKKERKGDVGYELHPDFHGKGIMQEALAVVLKYGFETIHFEIIEGMTHQENKSSIQLLKRNNFKKKVVSFDEKKDWPMNNELFFLQKSNY